MCKEIKERNPKKYECYKIIGINKNTLELDKNDIIYLIDRNLINGSDTLELYDYLQFIINESKESNKEINITKISKIKFVEFYKNNFIRYYKFKKIEILVDNIFSKDLKYYNFIFNNQELFLDKEFFINNNQFYPKQYIILNGWFNKDINKIVRYKLSNETLEGIKYYQGNFDTYIYEDSYNCYCNKPYYFEQNTKQWVNNKQCKVDSFLLTYNSYFETSINVIKTFEKNNGYIYLKSPEFSFKLLSKVLIKNIFLLLNTFIFLFSILLTIYSNFFVLNENLSIVNEYITGIVFFYLFYIILTELIPEFLSNGYNYRKNNLVSLFFIKIFFTFSIIVLFCITFSTLKVDSNNYFYGDNVGSLEINIPLFGMLDSSINKKDVFIIKKK